MVLLTFVLGILIEKESSYINVFGLWEGLVRFLRFNFFVVKEVENPGGAKAHVEDGEFKRVLDAVIGVVKKRRSCGVRWSDVIRGNKSEVRPEERNAV